MTQINSANIIASLIGKGREDEALEMYHSLGIDTADGYMAVLDILSQRGDDLRLLDLSRRGAQKFTAHAGIYAIYVQTLLKVGDASAAAKTAETFMERSGNQGLWALWAESLLGAYEFEKAGVVLNQYMPQNPFNAGAWIVTARLLWLHPIPDTKNVLQGLEQEIEDHSLEYSLDHGRMHFAAGLIHEALGDFDAAWARFTKGNDIFGAIEMPDLEEDTRGAQQVAKLIDSQWIKDHALEKDRSPRPLFIMGSPSSGITDLYTAATADPTFGRLGAPRMFERDLHRLCGAAHEDRYVEALSRLNKQDLEKLRSRYLAVNRDRIAGKQGLIDGLGSNILHAGILKAMFPDAMFMRACSDRSQEILDLFRLPLDPRAHRYTSNLASIEAGLSAQDALSLHWAQAIGPDWTEVDGPKRKAVEAQVPGWIASGQGGMLTSEHFGWPAPRAAARKRYKELSSSAV